MKKKMKALFPLLLVVVFIVSLAACSGGSDSGGKSGDAPAADTGTENTQAANTEETKTEPANDAGGEKVTITFAWWGDAKRHEKYNAIADLYEKENPYVKIERQYGSFNDYWDKLATQTAGGNAPDVQGMHATYVADYAQRGALLDLEPYLADGTIDIGSFPDSVKEVQKVEGKTVMIAQGVTMTGWNYNKGALDKLGVAAPDYNWTWDDFLAKVAEIQKAINASDNKKRWASVDASGDITGVQVYARQKGTDLFTAEGKGKRYPEEDILEGYAYTRPVLSVRKHFREVLKADPLWRGQQIILGKCQIKRKAHWKSSQTDQSDQPGTEEQIAYPIVFPKGF